MAIGKGILVAAAVVGAGTAAAMWQQTNALPETTFVDVITYDRSVSIGDGCSSVLGLVERVWQDEGGDSRPPVLILTTGDATSANEPVELARIELTTSKRVLEGRKAEASRRAATLASLTTTCAELERTNASPIFLSVKRSLEQTLASGCDAAHACRVWIVTDGQENEEPWFRKSLEDGKAAKSGRPAPLDNRNVQVTLCGFADTQGEVREGTSKRKLTRKRLAQDADLVTALWRSVFVEPERVVFEPLCPKGSAVTEAR
jgi:hypothetical protein